ncbi:MAG: divalent-cation tolerance protein CutA [Saprospiraceae bacterium]|jgi:periplasmic divalent cation tolerance protein|nr:divalent-cation tolerance protein CutA [Saprospiraceae bacterium]MBP9210849.1 divalent-cation tolerance protein CutA [Saprospiraceae bacterium]MBV6471776.1 Divalent-cation tolerance protein CutA [Saprospiraceae bacterium]
MESPNKICLLFSPFPDEASAFQCSEYLLNNKLAACVQRTPVLSNYLWNDGTESSEEINLIAKTLPETAALAQQAIRKMHPYEIPLIATQLVTVNEEYLAWMNRMMG